MFTLKRYYRPEWGDDWQPHFTVDRINGYPGHELKFDGQRLVANYLRVGFEPDGTAWRMYKLRPDFHPAEKVQVEDDITASVVLPRERVAGPADAIPNLSVKLVQNCEALLFQRPDDAIHRGFDLQAEADIAGPGTFLSNFEPLDREQAQALVDHVAEFDLYTEPMKRLLERVPGGAPAPTTSSPPRIRGSSTASRPRTRATCSGGPTWSNARDTYLADVGRAPAPPHPRPTGPPSSRSARCWPAAAPTRPSPRSALPPLAVYNPIHYQELPELFMDFMCSLTGKSPSTTGFGSEGALTKGPFNALWPVVDLNNALRLRHPHRLRRASPPPPATSGLTTAWITTSACWCPRSGAG